MRVLGTLTIVIFAMLAGCAEAPPAGPVLDEAPIADTLSELNVTVADEGPTSPYDLLFKINASAPVAGYILEIPEDIGYAACDSCPWGYIDIMVSTIMTDAPEGMGVLLFDLEDGDLVYGYLMEPVRGTIYLTAALPSDVDEPALYTTNIMRLSRELAGERLGVVVAGQGVTAPTGLAMHIGEEELGFVDMPQGEAIFQGRPTTPDAIGTGTGFDVDLHLELDFGLYVPGLIGIEAYVGEPTVEDRLDTYVKPHGGARDATVIATSGETGGWSYAIAGYYAGEGATQWSQGVRAGDHEAANDGYLIWGDGYGFTASALVWGLPIGVAYGDGANVPEARLDLQGVTDNDVYLLEVETISLDTPLGTLIGVNATGDVAALEGLLSADDASGTLSIDVDGTRIEHAGIWPTDL